MHLLYPIHIPPLQINECQTAQQFLLKLEPPDWRRKRAMQKKRSILLFFPSFLFLSLFYSSLPLPFIFLLSFTSSSTIQLIEKLHWPNVLQRGEKLQQRERRGDKRFDTTTLSILLLTFIVFLSNIFLPSLLPFIHPPTSTHHSSENRTSTTQTSREKRRRRRRGGGRGGRRRI